MKTCNLLRRVYLTSVLLGVTALLASTAAAQQGGGIITGQVSDSAGAVLSGAGVVITEQSTGAATSLQTNGDGSFTTPSLPIGTYTVNIKAAGFQAEERTGVVLQVDGNIQVNFTLHPGGVNQSVVVSTQVATVDQLSPTLGTVVEERSIQEVPINGRSVLALTQLSPGVHINAGPVNEGFVDRGTAVSAVSINNGPSAMNAILLDGQNNVQTYYTEIALNPTVDAIQEFKIETATMPAEYGFTAGGVINMVSRAGTNQYHGTVYEFLRNDYLNARNFFTPAPQRKPELRYNQFGGSFGGPIKHDKLQFFGNYEGYEFTSSTAVITSVPTAAQRGGDFSQLFSTTGAQIPVYDPATTVANPSGSGSVRTKFAGNVVPANRLDPVALNIQNFYPLPNITPSNALTNANNYEVLSPSKKFMRQALGRVDYTVSPRQTAYLRYGYFLQYFNNGGNAYTANYPVVGIRNDYDQTNSGLFEDTYVFSPSLVNEFRLAVIRSTLSFAVASNNGGWPQKLGLPAIVPGTTFPTISGNGPPAFDTGVVGLRAVTNPQLSDIVTLVRGKNSLRLGVDFRMNRGNNVQTSSPSGNYTFSSSLTGNPQSQSGTGWPYASFLLGAVASATEVLTLGEAERGNSISFFASDTLKASPHLNFILGLRYDYQQYPVEQNNGLSNFNPYVTDSVNGFLGAMQYAGVNGIPRSFRNTDPWNFAPRVGFAWDATHDGRTSVRGGYGIYYPSIFSLPFFGSTSGFASTTTTYSASNSNLPAFQLQTGFPYAPTQPLGAKLGPAGFLGGAVTYDPQHDGTTPLSQQWNLSLQRALPGRFIVDAAYTGNHGTHFIAGNINLDQLNPQYLSMGNALQNQVKNPYAGLVPGALGAATISLQQSLLAYPYYSSVNIRNPHTGDFIGHSLNISAVRQAGNGLTVIMAYTKSKLIDDSIQTPTNYGAVVQAGVTGYQNVYNIRAERAVDPLDISQFLNVSIVYDLPFGRGRQFASSVSGLTNILVGGWQLNTNTFWHTGLPLTISGANNNAATRPNFVPGVSAKGSNPSVGQWFNTAAFVNPPNYTFGNVPRSLPNVRGPNAFNSDVSLFKNTSIHEHLQAQLRLEAFNIFNHPNFSLPNMTFVPGSNGLNSSGTFGTITSASDPREYQVALKLIF
jgi:Carboxypeptidase regulatory-like domain